MYAGSTYLKSYCIIGKDMVYTTAEEYCRANGMHLYVMSPQASIDAMFRFAPIQWRSFWYIRVSGQSNGLCNILDNTGAGTPFKVHYGKCDKPMWSVCEYSAPRKSRNLRFFRSSLIHVNIKFSAAAITPRTCTASEFACGDGQCISIGQKCDRYPDCTNRQDESVANCGRNQ
jgi:Low-density lipoprotein receptor domain class A